jgi:hypothetical protein
MYFDYKLSLKSIEKARKIGEMRKKGIRWIDVASEMHHTRPYCTSLYTQYLKQKGGGNDKNV